MVNTLKITNVRGGFLEYTAHDGLCMCSWAFIGIITIQNRTCFTKKKKLQLDSLGVFMNQLYTTEADEGQ